MKIIAKPSFYRDVMKIRSKELKLALNEKMNQIEKADTISKITGLKLLRTFKVHYRIKVETIKLKYRIGAIIRNNSIWLVRFLPRKKVYKLFP